MKIEMYTQDLCGYCTAAGKEFEERGWTYITHNIKHKDNKQELLKRLPNVKTVPQIWIDDEHIGGYTDLIDWLNGLSHIRSDAEMGEIRSDK